MHNPFSSISAKRDGFITLAWLWASQTLARLMEIRLGEKEVKKQLYQTLGKTHEAKPGSAASTRRLSAPASLVNAPKQKRNLGEPHGSSSDPQAGG